MRKSRRAAPRIFPADRGKEIVDLRAFVSRQARINAKEQEILRIKSRIKVLKIVESAYQQSGSHQHNNGQRHLHGHKRATESNPPLSRLCPPERPPSPGFKRRGQSDVRSTERRRKAKEIPVSMETPAVKASTRQSSAARTPEG